MRLVSKILAILVMGLISGLAASPLAASFVDTGNSNYVFFGVFIVMAGIIFLAPTGRRAWGRGSLICGVLFVSMPLFVTALGAQVGSAIVADASTTGEEAGAAIGATLGAGLMVGASMIIGFIIGGVFLILGLVLVLGGRREVVIIDSAQTPSIKR